MIGHIVKRYPISYWTYSVHVKSIEIGKEGNKPKGWDEIAMENCSIIVIVDTFAIGVYIKVL